MYRKEIVYDRETRDYAKYLDGELVGFARTYHDAEIELDRLVYELLSEHTPERAAALIHEELAQEGRHEQAATDQGAVWVTEECWEEVGAPTQDELREWAREDVTSPPLATRSIAVGYDGSKLHDLNLIAAQILLPLAHLQPQICQNNGMPYLILNDRADIPAPPDDHAIVCDMIDALNEVAGQLPARPTSITAWMHIGNELYQVGHNAKATSPGSE